MNSTTGRLLRGSSMMATVVVLSCLGVGWAAIAASAQNASRPGNPPARPAAQLAPARPPLPVVTADELAARRKLEAKIQDLGRAFPGAVGVAVRDLRTGWTTSWRGTSFFPQQSVSKFWVALTALEQVDSGRLDLGKTVVVRRADLTLFHQPIATKVDSDGYRTTLNDLMVRALTESDNTANDFLMRKAGGPEAVRDFLKRHNIEGVRFGPGERLLQSRTAGLAWKQEYSKGNAFYQARSKVPMSTRRAALERYLANPVDGATPLGIVDGLAKLKRGALLSPASTRLLLRTMSNTRTGRQRLKGGLAPGWELAHKTGTGQDLAGTVAGYNDIGLVTSPRGDSYAVVVLIGRTRAGVKRRQLLMNDTVRAVTAYDGRAGSLSYGAR